MKVLAVTRLFPNPSRRTFAVFNLQMMRHLAQVCALRLIVPLAFQERLRIKRRELTAWASEIGLDVSFVTYYYTPGFFHQWHGDMLRYSLRRRLNAELAQFEPDVMLSSWAYPDTYAAAPFANRANVPLFTTLLGSDIHSLTSTAVTARAKKGLQSCERVLPVSNELAERLTKLGIDRERVSTVYYGVDNSKFDLRSRSESRQDLSLDPAETIALYVGNLVDIKRVDAVIAGYQAWQCSNKRLIIAGDGPLRGELERQAAAVDSPIDFLGAVAHEQLPTWMNAADVLVLLSRREGVPNVLLESMSCGVPVVATAVGGIPEVVAPEAGVLVDPDAPAKTVAQALDQAITADWARENIRRSVDRFSWRGTAAEMIGKFESALARATQQF